GCIWPGWAARWPATVSMGEPWRRKLAGQLSMRERCGWFSRLPGRYWNLRFRFPGIWNGWRRALAEMRRMYERILSAILPAEQHTGSFRHTTIHFPESYDRIRGFPPGSPQLPV